MSRARALAALGAGHVEQGADQIEKLLGREVLVEIRALGQVAERRLASRFGNRAAEHLGATARGEDQAHEHLERGGLARAVGAEIAEDLATPNLEAGFLDRLDALAQKAQVEGLGQPSARSTTSVMATLGTGGMNKEKRRNGGT